jgi:universal stress protein E
MRELNRILFVANGSEAEPAALGQATALAQANDVELLTVMNIRARDHDQHGTRSSLPRSQPLSSDAAADEETSYSISEETVLRTEGRSRVKLEAYQTLRDVIEAAERHDLVVKPADDGWSERRTVSAREDRQLLRECPCPVWIVKGQRHDRDPRVLAALDLALSESKLMLARAVLAQAKALAEQENAILHVVHAWEIRRELELRGRMNTSGLLEEMEAANHKQLDLLLREYPFPDTVVHLIKGRPRVAIPAVAEREKIDLVIVGNSQRQGLRRFVANGLSERLLDDLDCSLLAVRQRAAQRGRVRPPRSLETPRASAVSSAHA